MVNERNATAGTPIAKLSWCMVLLGLLEIGKSSNTELSRHLGFSTSQTSMIIKAMKKFGYVSVERQNSTKTNHDIDKRETRICLTKLGSAQAHLVKLSVGMIPGRDEMAEAIITGSKKILQIITKSRDDE